MCVFNAPTSTGQATGRAQNFSPFGAKVRDPFCQKLLCKKLFCRRLRTSMWIFLKQVHE